MKTIGDVMHELERIHDSQQDLHFLKDRLTEIEPISAKMCENVIILLANYRRILCEMPFKK